MSCQKQKSKIVNDIVVNEAVEMTPFTQAFSQNIESESHVN